MLALEPQDPVMSEARFTPGLSSFPATKLSLLFLLRTILTEIVTWKLQHKVHNLDHKCGDFREQNRNYF